MQVQIFLKEEDSYEDQPLFEHILRHLMHNKIVGATMFKGYMGFGASHHLLEPRKFAASDPLPVMIVFVDEETKVRDVLPHIRSVVSRGLITMHTVEKV